MATAAFDGLDAEGALLEEENASWVEEGGNVRTVTGVRGVSASHRRRVSRFQVGPTGTFVAVLVGTGLLMALAARAMAPSDGQDVPAEERSDVSLMAVKGSDDDLSDSLDADLEAELSDLGISKDDLDLDDLEEPTEKDTGAAFKTGCEEAQKGTSCYGDVQYALDHIKAHPDWYVGLNPHSSFKQVQAFMHKQRGGGGEPRCPKPCGHVEQEDDAHKAMRGGKCRNAQPGDDCYNHVTYTMKENLPNHPEWYPGLSQDADFKTVQNYLFTQDVCPKPCNFKLKKHKKEQCMELKGNKKLECLDKVDEENGDCHTAVAGEACYGDVRWAMKHLEKHNEWYKGLSRDSSFEEVQAFLHRQHNADETKLCPMPCSRKAVKALEEVDVQRSCHTAAKGTACYKSVLWVITDGIDKHPKWYPNLTKNVTFEEVQVRLRKNKDKNCPRDPCPCRTAQEGEKCWESIQWVKKVGVVNHSKWYKGLTVNSSMEDIQLRLHQDKHPVCSLPCVRTPWLRYGPNGTLLVVNPHTGKPMEVKHSPSTQPGLQLRFMKDLPHVREPASIVPIVG